MTESVGDRQSLISRFARHDGDTGSPEVQVALLSTRINHLTEHLKVNKKDKKIALSIKSLERTGDYDQVRGYMHSQEVVASNLGDLLKENLGTNFGRE